jgi:hypothetical protein
MKCSFLGHIQFDHRGPGVGPLDLTTNYSQAITFGKVGHSGWISRDPHLFSSCGKAYYGFMEFPI